MIACDVDGVITDFALGFSQVVQRLTDGRAPLVTSYKEIKAWEWPSWYWPEGFSEELNEQAWAEIFKSNSFWRDLEPLFPADLPYLQDSANGVPLVFLTRRDGMNPWGQTADWFRDYGIDEPLVVRLRSGEEKHDVCRRMGINAMIEDAPRYTEMALNDGMSVVLMSWPYNSHLSHPNLHRAYSLREALQIAKVLQ